MRGPLCLVNTSPLITVEYLLAISSVTGFINFEACLWSAICFQSMIAAFFHAGSTSISRFDSIFETWLWLAKNSLPSSDINRLLFGHLNFLLVHFWFPELQRIRKEQKTVRSLPLKPTFWFNFLKFLFLNWFCIWFYGVWSKLNLDMWWNCIWHFELNWLVNQSESSKMATYWIVIWFEVDHLFEHFDFSLIYGSVFNFFKKHF